jgi:hypothetical protein
MYVIEALWRKRICLTFQNCYVNSLVPESIQNVFFERLQVSKIVPSLYSEELYLLVKLLEKFLVLETFYDSGIRLISVLFIKVNKNFMSSHKELSMLEAAFNFVKTLHGIT